jgi:hypothetical protein
MNMKANTMPVSFRHPDVAGIKIFYREAGEAEASAGLRRGKQTPIMENIR